MNRTSAAGGGMAARASAAPRIVVVAGMHRSGTSTMARALQVLGIDLGQRLMPALANVNEKGFWEDLDLNAFNMEALSAVGSDWHRLSPITPADLETLRQRGFFLRAATLLREKAEPAEVFGFKDPRLGKLLPFWQQVFAHCEYRAGYVIAIRNPLSVAASLRERDRFDAAKSHFLWLEHTLQFLVGTRGAPRVVVDYDTLLEDPDAQLQRIATALGRSVDPSAAEDFKSDFLEASLRHASFASPDTALDASCPEPVRDLYAKLLAVARDEASLDDAALQAEIDVQARQLAQAAPLLQMVDRHDASLARLTIEVNGRDARIAGLEHAMQQKDGYNASLEGVVRERDGMLAQLHKGVAQKMEEIASLRLAAVRHEDVVRRLEHDLAVARSQDQAHAEALRESEEVASQLRQDLAIATRLIAEARQVTTDTVVRLEEAEFQVRRLTAHASELSHLLRDRERRIASLEDVVETLGSQLIAAQSDLADQRVHVANTIGRLASADQAIRSMESDRFWRLGQALRRVGSPRQKQS